MLKHLLESLPGLCLLCSFLQRLLHSGMPILAFLQEPLIIWVISILTGIFTGLPFHLVAFTGTTSTPVMP